MFKNRYRLQSEAKKLRQKSAIWPLTVILINDHLSKLLCLWVNLVKYLRRLITITVFENSLNHSASIWMS